MRQLIEIQPRERRIARHVLPREETQIANVLRDAVVAVVSDEESLEALSRDVMQDIRGVHARARLLQRRFTDIGPEDLDPGRRQAIAEIFQKGDGDRVDLFAGRAAGHPDPDRLFRGPAFAQRGKDVSAQRVERIGIAKELGHPDQEILVQRGHSPGSLSINAQYSSRLSIRRSVMRRSRRRLIVVRL